MVQSGKNSHPIIIASATRPANIKRLIFPENKHTTISAARTREITVFKRGCFKLFMSASNKEWLAEKLIEEARKEKKAAQSMSKYPGQKKICD